MIATWSDQLEHHGILGQKWGIRRFQNVDGTLTPAGRERYQQILKDVHMDDRSDYRNHDWRNTKWDYEKSGIRVGDSYDVIGKGSTFQRITDKNEILDSTRKYVSILPEDNRTYQMDWEYLGLKDLESAKINTLKATRDLKVATGKEVSEYILDKYGSKELKQAWDESLDFLLVSQIPVGDLKKTDQKMIRALKDRVDKANIQVNEFFKQTIFKDKATSDEIFNHFKKEGYDAILDMEDSLYTDYPLILLDPKNSVSLVESKSLN